MTAAETPRTAADSTTRHEAPPRRVPLKAAAGRMGISVSTLKRYIKRKLIRPWQAAPRCDVYITEDEINRFLAGDPPQ